jgi:hypothetical protein
MLPGPRTTVPLLVSTDTVTCSASGSENDTRVVSFTWLPFGPNGFGEIDEMVGCSEWEVIVFGLDCGPAHRVPSTEHWRTWIVCVPSDNALPLYANAYGLDASKPRTEPSTRSWRPPPVEVA